MRAVASKIASTSSFERACLGVFLCDFEILSILTLARSVPPNGESSATVRLGILRSDTREDDKMLNFFKRMKMMRMFFQVVRDPNRTDLIFKGVEMAIRDQDHEIV